MAAVKKPAGALRHLLPHAHARYLWDLYPITSGPGGAGLATRPGCTSSGSIAPLGRRHRERSRSLDHQLDPASGADPATLPGREAVVLHPFVDLDRWPEAPAGEPGAPIG